MNETQNDQKEQQIPKSQNISITFFSKKAVTFEDIIGHQVGANWVAVFTKDGSTKIYPAAGILEITIQITE